ncbi:alpha/beta hydrolase [Sporosarcina luteola]|uniref:alpha/beta hydrolase n=1 Tax=Sporosarcina luteola TaxID=582850 RepID=UPI00203D7F69|nr:alpha/beta fold hydrolase [Sporosarcina luteola]MCM3710636.1 alpha/beta hydrolase [Sporosarcina luteola]
MKRMEIHVENQQVVIKSDVLLKGTLTLPPIKEGLLPAILILAGSGKLNRDANAEKGKFQFNLYRDLAEHLPTLGFATLRYDKRGVGESEGNFERTGLWDAVTDAANALEFLASHPDIDPHRLIVIGHSEGCIVGTALYEKRPFNGLILLSGGGGGLRESLDYQRQQLYSELKQAKGLQGFIIRKFNTLDKGEKQAQATYRKLTTTNKDVVRIAGLIKMPAKYYREHFDYDIVEGLQHVACPVLAINGSKDFQSSVEFAKRIPENVKGPSTCIVVENMDHGLKEQLTPLSASTYKKDYIKTIGKPIHAEAIKHLDAWLSEWKEGSVQVPGKIANR